MQPQSLLPFARAGHVIFFRLGNRPVLHLCRVKRHPTVPRLSGTIKVAKHLRCHSRQYVQIVHFPSGTEGLRILAISKGDKVKVSLSLLCRFGNAEIWSFYIFHAGPASVRAAKRVEYRRPATPGFLPVGKVRPICTIFPTDRKNGPEFS